jgi:hypothetical protein
VAAELASAGLSVGWIAAVGSPGSWRCLRATLTRIFYRLCLLIALAILFVASAALMLSTPEVEATTEIVPSFATTKRREDYCLHIIRRNIDFLSVRRRTTANF